MLQRYRPNQSPTPKTRKWSELKKSGCIAGFVGTIEIVMVGKTDCVACHVMSEVRIDGTHEGDHEDISNCKFIYDVPLRDA